MIDSVRTAFLNLRGPSNRLIKTLVCKDQALYRGCLSGPSPRGGGSPKKGINKANKDLFLICSLICWAQKLRFLAFPAGPGGFRELREAGKKPSPPILVPTSARDRELCLKK